MHAPLRPFWYAASVLTLLGCALSSGGETERNGNAIGAALYAEKCAVCHGAAGQGVSAPPLRGWSKGRDALAEISARMPPNNPDRCSGKCADYVASFILADFQPGQLQCGQTFTAPRRLRLLTRREYLSTVADLFRLGKGNNNGTCGAHTFTYDPAGRTLRSVHVAGSFNNWPGTLAAGGWPLTYAADQKTWTLQRTLPAGAHQYKLVLDEKDWIADPKNPNTAPDGFGGQNSVLNISCGGGAGLPADLIAGFPPETRPEGFPFDDHADARVITPVHIEAYRQAASTLARLALQDPAPILPCDPKADAPACAADFVRSFGLRAFRRPLDGAEITRYKDLLQRQKDFPTGMSAVIQALLLSPHFLYRAEVGERQGDGTYRLTSYEIASALSYLFWGTLPDQALFDAARDGGLATPAGIEAQARRLLSDPRGREHLGHFALQWLSAEGILGEPKRADLFPGFSQGTRDALAEETRRFVTHVAFESSGKFEELFLADYSFLNDALGAHYGVPGAGPELRKTALPERRRAGLLGHGSVLGSHAHSDQTSPVRRGLFVRRNLLCQVLPPPPPNAGGVPQVDQRATTRERFRQHSADPFCNSCHRYIDPAGLGFERFDAVGRYRESENGKPIDPGGDMNDLEVLGAQSSASFSTLPELARMIAGSQSASACFVRQYARYARGARESLLTDLCGLTFLTDRFRQSGGDIRALLIAVTQSPDFVNRR